MIMVIVSDSYLSVESAMITRGLSCLYIELECRMLKLVVDSQAESGLRNMNVVRRGNV